ncbi:alpha-ribazole-5-phosphate synthase [Eubacteriaceae bacterium ES2]|nr:alpha-ribazole-5-phosphate synthase [Eubacteriaceae bacterium ES2]
MKTYLYRDLSVIELPDRLLVTACDSSAGVGEKQEDELHVPTKYVSIFATRVCLFELLACGCQIIGLANTICNEMEPTGKHLIDGIHEELKRAGLPELLINGSTEENFKTVMTGFGITIIGTTQELNLSPSQAGDLIVCIGKPKVGNEVVLENDTEIAAYPDLAFLTSCDLVNEVVPCGSKGILYEAQNLTAIYQLQLSSLTDALDLKKSCGPATTLIASVKENGLAHLQKHFGGRLNVIGQLTKKPEAI